MAARHYFAGGDLAAAFTADKLAVQTSFLRSCFIFRKSFSMVVQYALVSSQAKASFKGSVMYYKKNKLESLLNELASIWRISNLTKQQIKMRKNRIKMLNRFHTVFYWSNLIVTYANITAPLVLAVFHRFILNDKYMLKLPFGAVFPYDPSDNWFAYLSTYAFQMFTILHMLYCLISAEFLMITFCANLGMEFYILRLDLEYASSYDSDNAQNDQIFEMQVKEDNYQRFSIKDIFRRHQNLIRISKEMDEIFNVIVLVNTLSVTVIMCFFGFAYTVARNVEETTRNIFGGIAVSLPLYIFCYYGEFLKHESLGVADSAYNNLWYRENASYQKMIVLIILRSQRPCCLTAWGQVPVTLNMFTKVMSTTYSYFSLATSVYSGDDDSIN
ncbi:putative odorant receptor 92a [Battus philenor]|uniref:putative odorant receptor 92a n=1 Tax=Battus philenor TaxID=42288 RepID=UPI0035CEE316